jgi:HlyD family type I secretion membrane fusion protein
MSKKKTKLVLASKQLMKAGVASLLKPDNDKIASKPIRVGLWIVIVFVVGFGLWACIAPIGSAAIATGKLVVDFNRKTIQHFEGGIIEDIRVKEGQSVVTGEPLLVLRDISAKAHQKLIVKQLITAEAVAKRLNTERDNQKRLDFLNIKKRFKNEESLDQILMTQSDLFEIRRKAFNSKGKILAKRINQLEDEIKGLKAQRRAIQKQLAVMEKEIKLVNQLVESQNAPITRLMDLKKQWAELEGRSGDINAQIAKAGQAISETELEIINLDNDTKNQVLAELQDVEIKISDLTEQLTSAKDVLKRTIIKSPISGIVMNIKYHTIGAVVQPAADIMNIVPQDDQIIVEAKVKPDDIDSIYEGLTAKVQLSAYKAKKVPKLTGRVMSVSADSLTDEMSGMSYFLARIQLDESEIAKLKTEVKLNPGMPAQVFIITGSRTLFDYLFAPIKDATFRAFREE